MISWVKNLLIFVAIASLAAACGNEVVDESGGPQKLELNHDPVTKRLMVTVHPGLSSGETLHVRVRNGSVGVLECNQMASAIERIDGRRMGSTNGGSTYEGPYVDTSVLEAPSPYGPEWLDGPQGAHSPIITPEMIAQAEQNIFTVDICLMNGNKVVRNVEMDIKRALDKAGTGKFDGYGDANERIESVVAYAQACVAQMGEIPFFPKLEDGDYGTYNCLDSTPIPTVVTTDDGQVTYPEEEVDVCDNPQFIYSLCEANADSGRTNGPRVTSAKNEQGTYWVLLCRKAKKEEGAYDDIAMLGHNPFTGATCFFQNALYSRTDGLHVPHPADDKDSTTSPQQSATLWSGIQGGIGSGIQCVTCHDSDPIIHTPWIDGAKDANGDPVIPKMGIHDGLSEGFNDAPYYLVDREGQGWTMPKHLTSPEAAPCTKCHRIGDGRWARSWINRLIGKDTNWNDIVTSRYRGFKHMFWMPPEIESIDETTWDASEFGRAVEFIKKCQSDPTNAACKWDELPTEQIFDFGEMPTIELEGQELAKEALKIVGAQVIDPNDPRCTGENGSCETRRCAECHSVSKNGLKHWRDLTRDARNKCGLSKPIEEVTQEEAVKSIDCMRAEPSDPNSVFAADKVGILTTGARYSYFRKLFQKAYGENNWVQPFVRFKARVGMPKGTYAALSQREHAVLSKWFESNLANLNEVIIDPPAPASCENFVDTALMTKHVETMKYEGWGAKNKEDAGMLMFGCTTPNNCFADKPDRTPDWGAGAGTLREVLKLNFRSSFWTRSSADGRYIANGGGVDGGSTITDMLRGVDIKVKASYDPGFFPDNSGFIFQGGGTGICNQSILATETDIDFEEPGCMRATDINLYQHVASGLDSNDYFIINSQFTSDSGSSGKDPKAHFSANATMKFSPMIHNGTTFEQFPAKIVDSPFEGDSVLSPSGQLVISRLAGGPDGGSWGFVVRRVVINKKSDGSGYETPTINELLGRFCYSGAKANISFDERYFVTHHYEEETANIYLTDMLTGQTHQVTKMPAGVKALFPHFRSDNLFYFLVKGGDEEYVVSSDLAIILGNNAQ